MPTSGAVQLPRYAPSPRRPLSAAIGASAGLAVVIGAALLLIGALTDNFALMALSIPAAVGAVACAMFPAPAILALVALTGMQGTAAAFLTWLPLRGAIDLVLLGLWLGVLGTFLSGRERPLWLWPGVIAPALYLALTAVEIFTAETVSAGFEAFRLGPWSMMAFLVIALAPWRQGTFVRIAQWAVVIVALIGAYNVYRYVVGAAPEELAVARATNPGQPRHLGTRFFGSFPSAQRLAGWCSILLPLMLVMALTWRGHLLRFVAIGAAGMCGFAVVASDVLTGAFAAIAAIGATVLLYTLARAFPSGQRVALGTLAAVGILAVAGAGYALTVSGDTKSEDKFSYLLDPFDEPTFQNRLDRWEQALDEIDQYPVGHGLGTAGTSALRSTEIESAVAGRFDSSYLKVAFEQGFVVMVLYIACLVALLIGLGLRAVSTPDPVAAALGIAGVGALVAMMAQFFAGFYSDSVQTLAGWIVVGLGVAQFTGDRRDAPAQSPPPPEAQIAAPEPLAAASARS